ncbi:1-acyl-sn-glycerol-3-phosphate acyltransferase [Microcoleus sp. FACHB-1515]|uniref:1-acyl-sn-glycerol-3-phosphate acyltransferase n=1 Tax=Cyanophyceae TaxID=3028117 RepID=UPI0016895F04|nr:1-acyl-sn-glycerol-3-phosphate acyltransferase [Microcoleus sp. FACHB-1515]MBD2091610.1 1-acyl-sn-glycerol-3-phosphate acyltransferase [Microcoleus sp. FACHB-1515]
MSQPVRAQPPLRFIPPNYTPIVRSATRLLLPYLRWHYGIGKVEVEGIDRLADLYADFAANKTRFLLAFRHSNPNDPLCMATLVWNRLPRAARARGLKITQPPHSHFIYDRGIPLWAGKLVGWTYAHLGGTPIRRGKADLAGLKSARQLFANGSFPIGAAPEGATNGHNCIVGAIEPGIAQFGFWCVEDLQKSDRSEDVLIVPIGIQYFYDTPPWNAIDRLLRELETATGLEAEPAIATADPLTPDQEMRLYQRLLRLGGQLLTQLEQFYSKFYHQPLPTPAQTAPLDANLDVANAQIADRLSALMNAALTVSEITFNLPPKGSFTDRCRRLEQAAWDRIYREDLPDLETLSPIDRALADRVAQEAEESLWHMRIVETLVSVTGHYVREKFTADRFAETLLLLWDVSRRIQGQFPFPRPKLACQTAIVTVGEPLSVSDRHSAYKANRRQAVTDLTADLQTALEKLIR